MAPPIIMNMPASTTGSHGLRTALRMLMPLHSPMLTS